MISLNKQKNRKQCRAGKKTLICLLLLLFLCAMGLSATGQQETGTETAATKPDTVKLLTGFFRTDEFDTETTHIIEQKTNTILDVTAVHWGDFVNKQNVVFASGDYPDITNLTGGVENEIKFLEAGILLPLNEYFDEYQDLADSRSEEVWEIMRWTDGNIYAVPNAEKCRGKVMKSHTGIIYRQDWLDALGMEVPETIEEYYEVAYAISHNDPDGNGKNDTYAFSAQKGKVGTFQHVFAAFGVLLNDWTLKDGHIVSCNVQPGMQEALRWLNKMYNDGIIDPEFITDDPKRLRSKALAGTYGANPSHIALLDEKNYSNHHDPYMENNPEAILVVGPFLEAEGYQKTGFKTYGARGWLRTGIVAEGKNEKQIEAALRVLDFACSEEGTMLYNYGVEGKHYTVEEDGSVKLLVDQEGIEKAGIGLFHIPITRVGLVRHTSQLYQDLFVQQSEMAHYNPADGIIVPELGKYEGILNNRANKIKQITLF